MEKMSRENAREMEFYGSTLEECVNALLKLQNRGESVFVNFNGHKLYSCDVTMDSAFLEVVGKTKAEHDKAMEEWRENYRKEEEKAEAEATAKIPEWIKKGEAFIYPERLGDWKKCVEARASDLYHGWDLDAALDLMERLENGESLDDVKAIFDEQGHSGASAGMVRNILFSFSKQGPEFWEHTAYGEISPENKQAIADKKAENMKLAELYAPKDVTTEKGEEKDPYAELKASAVEVDFSWKYGNTLDAAVKELEEYRARGESVVIDFNGHKLYSCDITMDGAYQEVLGKTKAEHDKAMEEWRENYRKEEEKAEAEATAKIPKWIKKGESFIYPERLEEWKKCVEGRASDLYHGMDLDSALDLMERLENGATLDEVQAVFDEQGHSGASAGMVRNILFHFSKRGPEFWEHTAYGEISAENKQAIADKKAENAKLDEIHKADSDKEVSEERRTEEQEISEKSTQKEQLTQEISDIDKELEALRAKEAELKQQRSDKKAQLDGLEDR